MKSRHDCPLSPALLKLLQVCLDAETTETNALADKLCLSPKTVHTEFRRICELMNVHSRSSAIIVALKNEWIALASDHPPVYVDKYSHSLHFRCCEPDVHRMIFDSKNVHKRGIAMDMIGHYNIGVRYEIKEFNNLFVGFMVGVVPTGGRTSTACIFVDKHYSLGMPPSRYTTSTIQHSGQFWLSS